MYKISEAAQNDLRDIAIYWFERSNNREAVRKLNRAIKDKLKQLGQNALTGTMVEKTELRVGYAASDLRFAIYYLVYSPKSIEIVMIRDTKQPKPTQLELNNRVTSKQDKINE